MRCCAVAEGQGGDRGIGGDGLGMGMGIGIGIWYGLFV